MHFLRPKTNIILSVFELFLVYFRFRETMFGFEFVNISCIIKSTIKSDTIRWSDFFKK